MCRIGGRQRITFVRALGVVVEIPPFAYSGSNFRREDSVWWVV